MDNNDCKNTKKKWYLYLFYHYTQYRRFGSAGDSKLDPL